MAGKVAVDMSPFSGFEGLTQRIGQRLEHLGRSLAFMARCARAEYLRFDRYGLIGPY